MLSIENIPDPSCSFKAPPLKADERVLDPVGLVETQTSNFSIRGYAFASRSIGIETNWPFPQRFLQLCLKHGIEELLPSFEQPDLVRSQCWRKPVDDLEAEHIVPRFSSLEIKDPVSNGFDPKSCLPSEELVLEADHYPSQKEGKQIVDEVLDHYRIKVNSSQICKVEFARHLPMPKKLDISRDLLGKKCKLLLKLSTSSQSRRTEDLASTSSTISDPMASKVCPVCKLFSSTSNTTLNAHIDQCLFMESNTNTEEIKISNLKVKPSKKRLMVDIYATAPYSTLEDLDRRNGTTWARDLAPTEIKRPRLSPEDIRCDGGDEAVYVDSNGVKLRILSPMMPSEESKLEKPAKEISEGKDVMFSQNKQFGQSYLKHIAAKPLCKKPSPFEMPRDESEASPVSEYHIETLKEKEEAHSAVDDGNHSRHLRQWVCSKRSDLPKKMKKSIHQFSKNPETMTERKSVVRSHSLDRSRSTKDLTYSPRIKTSDLQTRNDEKAESSNPHVHKVKWSSGSTLSNGSRPKLSRSCTASSSYHSSMQNSDNDYHCQRSMKAKKLVSLKNILVRRPYFPLEPDSGDAVQNSPKMFRKKRSILVSSKRRGEVSSDGNGACKEVRTFRSNYSKSALSSRAKQYVEQMSPKGKNTQESQVPSDAEYHVSCDTIISDHLVADFIPDVDPNPSGGNFGQSVCGTKTREEPTKERFFDSFDVTRQDIVFPTNIQVADEMDFRGKEDPQAVQIRESRAETLSAQESSACLTSHGDLGLEVRPENSSVTSSQIIFNENQSLASNRDPSFSPGSTASTISTPSRRPESFGEGDIISEKEHEHPLDSHHCCCSRREGLSGEFPFPMMPSKGKQVSNLYMTPRLSSVSCSSARIEPTTEPNLTKLFVDPASSFPTGLGSNGTPSTPKTPSTPNSVLRLMGKNLMVLKEESTQHSNDAQSTPSENPSPSLGFVPTRESFWYHRNYQVHRQSHPKKTSHFLPYQKQAVTSSRTPYDTKEVIVIDDSPETVRVSTMPVVAGSNTVAQQRPFSCFPISRSQYISRDVSGGFRLVYPKPGPWDSANPVKSPEGFCPLLPGPLFYQPVFYP